MTVFMRFPLLLLTATVIVSARADIDHVKTIQSFGPGDVAAGKKIYTQHCVSCHGTDGNLTPNPLARRFARDELKFGADPYALWKTISYGNGMMFRYDSVLDDKERYQVVHYIREAFIRQNAAQYTTPTNEYFVELPKRAADDTKQFSLNNAPIELEPGMRDGRMGKDMVYGPAQSHSLVLRPEPKKPKDKSKEDDNDYIRPTGSVERALIVALPADAVVAYDTARFSVAGLWAGRFANTARTHHTSYKGQQGLTPGSSPSYVNVGAPGWRLAKGGFAPTALRGHYLHGDQVLLSYSVAERPVLELPGAVAGSGTFLRSFEIGPGDAGVLGLVGSLPGARFSSEGAVAALVAADRTLHATVAGDTDGLAFTADADGNLWLRIPAQNLPRRFTLGYGLNRRITASELPAAPDFRRLTSGGPRRWSQSVTTRVVPGDSIEGYAADEFTLPIANPWGSWMRMSALDFFADGRIAVSTLSGDVWIVTPAADDPERLSWSRFANGLYEPLGLRIVDETVYVRCRDRIVRLRDLNADGEADFYESFYNEPGEIGTGYHSFIFELQTDRAGNFYYSKSGRKSPHEAAVVRISPDGTRSEVVATDMRHPNGMGAGGPRDWVTVSDNPSGQAIYNGFSLVSLGATLGYKHLRNLPMVMVLPATADASSTGQVWSDPQRWGPLGGSVLHTSYSHCAMFYVSVQDVPPFPNGFAIRLPFRFKAGLMRSRIHPLTGQVYTVGLKGWDTNANFDGCFYRIRYTGEPSHLIQNVAATRKGVAFTLSCDIDPASIGSESVTAVREGNKKGVSAPIPLGRVAMEGSRCLTVDVPGIEAERVERRTSKDPETGATIVEVRMPFVFTVNLKAVDGTAIQQTVFATINSLP